MKLVYLAHPYGGREINELRVDAIIKSLFKRYPDVSFVSPIHGIRCGYNDVEMERGLAYCLELMSRCDEVILAGDWKGSVGCIAEAALACKLGIPAIELQKYTGKPNNCAEGEEEVTRND